MDDEQHADVWTLMKYFKARELWVVGLQTSPLPNCEKSEIGWRAKAFRHVEINHDLGVCRRDFKTPSLVVQRLAPEGDVSKGRRAALGRTAGTGGIAGEQGETASRKHVVSARRGKIQSERQSVNVDAEEPFRRSRSIIRNHPPKPTMCRAPVACRSLHNI